MKKVVNQFGFRSAEGTVDRASRPKLVARITDKFAILRLSYEIQREICELMVKREVERLARLGLPFDSQSTS
jgi:ATP-dependent Clp protease ATP-binding subunit ClpB